MKDIAHLIFYNSLIFVCGHLNEMKVTMDGSNTTSILNLMLTAKDHDAELICLAANPVFAVRNASIGNNGTISSVETRRRLVVHCKAIISSLSVAYNAINLKLHLMQTYQSYNYLKDRHYNNVASSLTLVRFNFISVNSLLRRAKLRF